MSFTADFTLAFAPFVEGGVDRARFDQTFARAQRAAETIKARAKKGELGFWTLPDNTGAAAAGMAAEYRAKFDRLVVLGIGGSSLGGRALRDALAPGGPVEFWENVDPVSFSRKLASIDFSRTCFNVISKSGGTVETAAQFCIVRDELRRRLGDAGYRERVVVTTDPKKGVLRALAHDEGLDALTIPDSVGGRFSVLTPVGLFPAAFLGIDDGALLRGARAMRKSCGGADPSNIAAALAAVLFEADQAGRHTHVLMPYADGLKSFTEWFVQLWAESLGKADGRHAPGVHCGPLPHGALGATDQHSQVQLFMEGPQDKFMMFMNVEASEDDSVRFPDDVPAAYQYLRGHSLGKLLAAEREGTSYALARAGRPSLRLGVGALTAESMGALLFLFEAATAIAGELYDIDAFDQPGVEAGKRIAFAKLGREGYAEHDVQPPSAAEAQPLAFSVNWDE